VVAAVFAAVAGAVAVDGDEAVVVVEGEKEAASRVKSR
jgi:hypothetical protein